MFTSTQRALRLDVVLFVERSGEFMYAARLSTGRYGAEGKPRVNSPRELHIIDPKPGDLSMCRLKVG